MAYGVSINDPGLRRSGLSQPTLPDYTMPNVTQADPTWYRLVAGFGFPLISAVSSRIAYGQTTPPRQTQTLIEARGFEPAIGMGTIALVGGGLLLAVFLARRK